MMKVEIMKVQNDGNDGDDEQGWRDDARDDHDDEEAGDDEQ